MKKKAATQDKMFKSMPSLKAPPTNKMSDDKKILKEKVKPAKKK